jgi:hypothetical protein
MLETIKRIYNAIEKICVFYTFISIVVLAAIYFNWIPGYYVEWHRTDSIKPLLNVFPGQKVRFDMAFYEPSPEIATASWQISKGSIHFDIDKTKPTFTLPPTMGGTYILSVTANTVDGQLRKGQSILSVVDDKPVTVQLKAPAKVTVTSQDANPALLQEIKTKGVEVYSGHDHWITAKDVTMVNGGVTFGLQPNDNVSLFGDKILIRAQGNTSNLNGYGAASMSVSKVETMVQPHK